MEKDRLKSTLVVIAFFFVLLFAYTRLAGPIPFSVNSINTNKADLFTAQGQGSATAVPDRARITLGVTQSSGSVQDAQARLNQKVNQIIDALANAGVNKKDIKTTNYSINPEYNNGQKISSYSVSESLEVASEIDLINKVIDVGIAQGANLAGGVEFVLDDDKRLELENSARKEAVDNAKKRAEGLARAAGLRLGRVVNVQESNASSPGPVFLSAKTDQAVTPEDTNIQPGESKIEINVTVSYETL